MHRSHPRDADPSADRPRSHRSGRRGRSRQRSAVLALAIAGVTLAIAAPGCSQDAGPADAAPPTTLPPHRDPTATHPLRVVLAGDSVMLDNLEFGFVAALNEGGEALASQVWLLSLTRDVSSRLQLKRTMRAQDPDLLVVAQGVWELDAVEDDMHDPGWREHYEQDVVRPFVDRVTADGAEVLWIGIPAWNNPPGATDLATLQDVYREVAADDDRVAFLDAADYVDDPSGAFTYQLPGPDGTPEPVRNRDGLHLCPAGVVRVVAPALAWIQQQWRVTVAPGWRHAGWDHGPDGGVRESFEGCRTD